MYNEQIIKILKEKKNGMDAVYEYYLSEYKKTNNDTNYYTLYGIILGISGCNEINDSLKNDAIHELIYLNEKEERRIYCINCVKEIKGEFKP